ncbi:hypothetical protein COMNV_00934 [Commensalibacter sp. Nvir]|uniref:lysylphosphatidylglycerol synthase domain-containing protein n=1 Tax=Commensalibacter sp. Nvir TaxID=3069817 RepID=UPI002D266689|nr:hypothetical protein COMNV_00934 [Commensalibacter sp. Nvir]
MHSLDYNDKRKKSFYKKNSLKKTKKSFLFKIVPRIVGIILFSIAIYVLYNEFTHLSLKEIQISLKNIPTYSLIYAGLCTLLSFFVLSFYDKLAVKQVGYPLSFWKSTFASFCSYVLSHNIGFSALSGAVVRFRLYGSWGLQPLAIMQIIAFCSVTYMLGAAVLVGGLFIFESNHLPVIGQQFPAIIFIILGSLAWIAVIFYVFISFYCSELKLWKYRFSFPSPTMALAQIGIATAEVIATAAIPYCIIPDHAVISSYQSIDFASFLSIYIASYTAGLIASVPGGAGVFEGSMLLGLKPYLPVSDIVCVIFIFRLFYYLVPLFFAGILFASYEVFLKGEVALHNNAKKIQVFDLRPIPTINQNIRESDAAFSVLVGAAAVGICGLIVLALPVVDPTIWQSQGTVFSFIEVIGDYALSFFGLLLLIMTIALIRRITVAWRLSLFTLIMLVAITLIRGAPLYIPAMLALVAFFIAPFRSCYYRTASFLATPLSFKVAVEVIILLVTVYVIICINPPNLNGQSVTEIILSHHVSLHTKWIVGLMVAVGSLILFQMTLPAKIKYEKWSDEHRKLYELLSNSKQSPFDILKPTHILICSTEGTLIPFIKRNNVIIGLGDPVGNEPEIINTIWRLRDLSVQENCSIAFWEVKKRYLSVYRDLGLVDISIPKRQDFYVCCEPSYTNTLMRFIQRIGQKITSTSFDF